AQGGKPDRQPPRVAVRPAEQRGQSAAEGVDADGGGSQEEQQFGDAAPPGHASPSSSSSFCKTGGSRSLGSGGICSPDAGRRTISLGRRNSRGRLRTPGTRGSTKMNSSAASRFHRTTPVPVTPLGNSTWMIAGMIRYQGPTV